MKKILDWLVLVTIHIIACAVIIAAFWPMAQWYFANPIFPPSKENTQAKPLWGVDFYYTTTLTKLLRDNVTLPTTGWGYQWFTGWPFLSNYPILNYYLILPFTYFFDLIAAVKIWMLVSFAFYFIGIYATCYLLSRNPVVSALIAIGGIYSVGVYGTLMWGGSLPNHATQAFLPWVVFFLILYLNKNNTRYLFLSSLLAGIAIWGHPQIVIAYIYPFTAILLLFSFWGISFVSRIKALLIFVGISFLIGLPLLYTTMGSALKVLLITNSTEVASSTARTPSATTEAIAAFHRAQPARIYIDTNTTIFALLAFAFIFFLFTFVFFSERRKRFLAVFPFLILAAYMSFYIWIFSYGISIYHGGWYRLFWATPFWLGMVASSLWGSAQVSITQKFARFSLPLLVLVSFFVCVIGVVSLLTFSKGVKERVIPRSNASSAYPDVLNLRTDTADRQKLRKKLVPDWLPADQTDFRLYCADQTVNIWWNAIYKMPLARGYLDPPVSAQNRGYFFWLDAALSQDNKTGEDQLVASFKYPPEVAFNNTLFLIDWYAVKYFEAGHEGPTVFAPIPKSLDKSEYMDRQQILDFNDEKYHTGNQKLHYYAIKDQYVSPILIGTNAKTLGIVATDQGYETIIRGIGDMNISSQKLIPIKLGSHLDKISARDLSAMDALILYDYTYKNRGNAFRLVQEYVKRGRKVFIDTGVEVKESVSDELPEIFPFERSDRKSMGSAWGFDVIDERFSEDIDFSVFDPPLFDTYEWKVSFPRGASGLREGVEVILKNHDIPILISYGVGEGKTVWSGLNLPYHVIRSHNEQEIQFFQNILTSLFSTLPEGENIAADISFVSPQQRTIMVNGAKGVLFKEQAYPGWHAAIVSAGKKYASTIYKAGPAYPGFMYVRLPSELLNKQSTITFQYRGSLMSWILIILAFGVIIVVLEESILAGKVLGKVYRFLWKEISLRLGFWWKREDE